MIDCVSVSNNHLFSGNPLYEQYKLRYACNIKRQGWNVPTIQDMEYDSYDNPATHYFIWRDQKGTAKGLARLYPTDRPYMLQEAFSHLVTKINLPKSQTIWEGSRFCIDEKLPVDLRKRIMHEIVLGYLEFSLARNIDNIIGVMFPVYWRNIFVKSGWPVEWIGEEHRSNEGHKIIAGSLPVSQQILLNVQKTTGIFSPVLRYGETVQSEKIAA